MNTSSEVTYSMRAATFGKHLKDKYHEFLTNVAEQSKKGVDIYRYASPLFEETSAINFTDLGIVYNSTTLYNLKTVLIYLSFCCTLLTGETDREKLNQFYNSSKYFGTLITSIQTVTDPLDIIMSTLKKMSQDEAEDSKKMLPILSILFAVVYGVVSIVLTVLMCILYIKEINKFAQMLLNLPENVKNDSISSIRKVIAQATTTDEQEIDFHSGSSKKSFTSIILLVVISIVYIAVAILIYFHINNVKIFNEKYMYLNMWQADSRISKSYVAQLCLWLSQIILKSNPLVNESRFIDLNAMKNLSFKDKLLLNEGTKDMFDETSNYPSPIGVNPLIDKYTLQPLCEMNNISSFHETYICSSLKTQQFTFLNIVYDVLFHPYQGVINGSVPSHIVHLANCHLIPLLMEIDDTWSIVETDYQSSYSMNHIIFFVVQLILEIVTLIFCCYIIKVLNESYDVVLALLRRVNPIQVAASQKLINYILGKNASQNPITMSTAQAIIFNSTDAVIFLEINGIVDIMNPSFTSMLGYTPEQLLGQSCLTISCSLTL